MTGLWEEKHLKVAIKYCGSCNSYIDLERIGRELRTWLLDEGFGLVPADSSSIDLIVILNGCETACADRPEVRARARRTVVVAGEIFGSSRVPERNLSEAILHEITNRVVVHEL
jgi:hypothetical protein